MAIVDENYLCGNCGGVMAPLEEQVDELIRYGCTACGRTGPVECPLCHNPRTIWQDYGKKCLLCSQSKEKLTSLFKMLLDNI